jgi:hypothetical protein
MWPAAAGGAFGRRRCTPPTSRAGWNWPTTRRVDGGATGSSGTSWSIRQIPSARSRVNGYAALCDLTVRDGGPNSASRSASWGSISTHDELLDPVEVNRPSASSTSSGLCGERRPSRWCWRSDPSAVSSSVKSWTSSVTATSLTAAA